MWRERAAGLAAGALYLAVALWTMRAVLPSPSTRLPFPAMFVGAPASQLGYGDQKLVVSNIYEIARRLVTRPWALFEGGQCYPVEDSVTLGEHMIAEGILGVVPALLTRDPILTYNVVVISTLWLAGVGMYALVRHWTGSAGAAFVAGLLFMLHPTRVVDPIHPFVHGNLWTPFALLFAHRLVVGRRWRDAAGLSLFLTLQTLESIYPLIGLLLLGGLYGLWLLVRHRDALGALVPKLLVSVAPAAVVAVAVMMAYRGTWEAWGVLVRGGTLLHSPLDFGFGRLDYPGSLALLLAAVGLLDRVRGARRVAGDDPRLVVLLGGVLILWTAVWALPIPFLGLTLPSLFHVLVRIVPGLDAVRAGGAIGTGVHVALAFLAGYGVLVLLERAGRPVRSAGTAVLAALVAAEVFHPALVAASWGASTEFVAYEARPSASLLARYSRLPEGAVLDLPFTFGRYSGILAMADYLLLSAYHRRPVAACYNSFKVPVEDEIEALAARLPDAAAADALYALGFRSLVLHGEYMHVGGISSEIDRLERLPEHRLIRVETADLQVFYRLRGAAPFTGSLEPLVARDAEPEVVELAGPRGTVPFVVRNRGKLAFRHPTPIRPTRMVARWRASSGALVAEEAVTALLPLALAPADTAARPLELSVAVPAGSYEVALAPAREPDLALARRRVRVDGAR